MGLLEQRRQETGLSPADSTEGQDPAYATMPQLPPVIFRPLISVFLWESLVLVY